MTCFLIFKNEIADVYGKIQDSEQFGLSILEE